MFFFKCLFNKKKPVHPVHLVRWFTIILICQSRINFLIQNISVILQLKQNQII